METQFLINQYIYPGKCQVRNYKMKLKSEIERDCTSLWIRYIHS